MTPLTEEIQFRIARLLLLAAAAAVACSAPALAAAYPVQGRFAYDKSDITQACDTGPTMDFSGDRRFDDGGGVHDYRNVSVFPDGVKTFAVTDLFFNGQIRGKISYTLHVDDPKHLRLDLAQSGKSINLVRCP